MNLCPVFIMYTRDVQRLGEITSGNVALSSLLILKCLHSIRIRLEWILLASLEGDGFSVQVQLSKC